MHQGLAPLATNEVRVLVLGTLPGQLSLQKGEYYAHPRNVFWRLMGDLVGAGPELAYEARCTRLNAAGIALWDVCDRAARPGSLDADIDVDTVEPNDIAGFLRAHRQVTLVCFNGAKAATLFRRLILPNQALHGTVRFEALPSTSPANAAMPYEGKLRKWSVVRDPAQTAGDV
jgi:TDG/mug DNA glycosylase family protein